MADYKISFHYNGCLINMETLPSQNTKMLIDTANKMIIETMKQGVKLPTQIATYKRVIEKMVKRIEDEEYVSKLDRRLCSLGVLSLIKLKHIDNDEKNGFLIVKNKSKIKRVDPGWLKMSA